MTTERLPTLANILAAMRAYLALDEIDHVLFTLAVAVASYLDGDPLWGMLVGAPSSGKTEALRMLDDIADEHLGEITVAGLLSWSKGRKPEKRGLLARRPGRVFATIGDLSTMLAMSDRGSRDMLYSLLRRAYDGSVHRDIDGPEQLRWEGRLTLLAACTPSVDVYASHSDALGPRWLYLRLPSTDAKHRRDASRKARDGVLTLAEHRSHVRILANAIVREARVRVRDQGRSGNASATRSTTRLLSPASAAQASRATATAVARSSVCRPSRSHHGSPASSTSSLAGCSRLASTKRTPVLSAVAPRSTRCRANDSRASRRSQAAKLSASQRSPASPAATATSPAAPSKNSLRSTSPPTSVRPPTRAKNDRGPWHLTGENAELIQAVLSAPRGVPKSVKPTPIPPRSGETNLLFGTGAA